MTIRGWRHLSAAPDRKLRLLSPEEMLFCNTMIVLPPDPLALSAGALARLALAALLLALLWAAVFWARAA